jgi:opacity protein-like surface antigen
VQYGEQKLVGITAFFDADSARRIGIEGEGRWLEFHESASVHAETYMIGPRYHFDIGRFQPYVKGMVGFGEFNFPYNFAHGSYLLVAAGGGVDYRLSRRWSVRLADVEYQNWPQFTFGSMTSVGVSAGIRYRIF